VPPDPIPNPGLCLGQKNGDPPDAGRQVRDVLVTASRLSRFRLSGNCHHRICILMTVMQMQMPASGKVLHYENTFVAGVVCIFIMKTQISGRSGKPWSL
jgi:hypothetical protein